MMYIQTPLFRNKIDLSIKGIKLWVQPAHKTSIPSLVTLVMLEHREKSRRTPVYHLDSKKIVHIVMEQAIFLFTSIIPWYDDEKTFQTDARFL